MFDTSPAFDALYNFELATEAAARNLIDSRTGRVKSIHQIARELEYSPKLLDYRHITCLVPGATGRSPRKAGTEAGDLTAVI